MMKMVQNVNSRSIHVNVLTISRFMLHRAAAAKASNFWPHNWFVWWVGLGGCWCHCCHRCTRTVSVVCLSLCFRLIPKKKIIFHMALLLSFAHAMNEDVCPHKQTCHDEKKVFYWLSESNLQTCKPFHY